MSPASFAGRLRQRPRALRCRQRARRKDGVVYLGAQTWHQPVHNNLCARHWES